MPAEDEVRRASAQFYAALNAMVRGDAKPMSDIWSHGTDVTTMHPLGGRQVGWDEVRQSWEQVAGMASDGKVELRDQFVHATEDVGYEIGVEHARFTLAGQDLGGQARVTNVYEREHGGWKIRHHHTDLIPEMIEVVNRLQGSQP